MKSLSNIGLDIVRERSELQECQHGLLLIIQRRDKLSEIFDLASHHLRDATACKSMKDQLEHWNLYLHRSYVTSELYRPTLKQGSHNPELTANLNAMCIESLADTVDAFLGLENITRFAHQSWAALHRALSSALLLSILKEPVKNQRVRTLLNRLIDVMSDLSSTLSPSELSAPITRWLSVMCHLNSHEVGGQPRDATQAKARQHVGKVSDFELSPMVSESSASPSSAPDRSIEASPYALMDKIFWGTQHMSSI
jgi:hypothetical protein